MNHVTLTGTVFQPDSRETVIARALAELEKVKEKYKNLQELAGIFAEIDRLTMERGA